MRKRLLFSTVMLIAAAIICPAAEIMHDDLVVLPDTTITSGDLYMFGRKAIAEGTVDGDLTACAQKVQLSGIVRHNFYSAAQLIEVEGEIGSDFIGFAQDIVIDGKVRGGFRGACAAFTLNDTLWGDVIIGAGEVEIGRNAVVYGDIYAGAGEIDIRGRVEGNIIAYVERFKLSGSVTGTVKIMVEEMDFSQGAMIGGNLRYKSEEEFKDDFSPYVDGEIYFTKYVEDDCESCGWIYGLWFFLGSVIIALLIGGFFGKWLDKGAELFELSLGKALGIGFLSFFVLPVAGIIVLVTVIGIPLGIILLLLYGIFLYLGWIIAAAILGNWGLKMIKWEKAGWILTGIIGLVVLSLLAMIPVLGCLINFCAMILGLGLILLLLHSAFWGNPGK